jgi:hypothetical protein
MRVVRTNAIPDAQYTMDRRTGVRTGDAGCASRAWPTPTASSCFTLSATSSWSVGARTSLTGSVLADSRCYAHSTPSSRSASMSRSSACDQKWVF